MIPRPAFHRSHRLWQRAFASGKDFGDMVFLVNSAKNQGDAALALRKKVKQLRHDYIGSKCWWEEE